MSASGRAVLLDALGTLVTFAPPAPALRALLAERHGVDVAPAAAQRAIAREIAFYRAEHHRASDHAALAELRRDCAEVVREALDLDLDAAELVPTLVDAIRFEVYPEVAEVLAVLRSRGHPLGVVSNWDVSLHDVLRATGIEVDVVVTSAEAGVAKPDPALFALALDALGAEGGWHAGDTEADDVTGALAAGLDPVLVCRESPWPPSRAPRVADLRGLLRLT